MLPYGIPDEIRPAFEADLAQGEPASDLGRRYPGIANAYSPEEWRASFEARLGPAAAFGALWAD